MRPGTPIGYKMMVNAAPQLLAIPGSLLAKRGEFATRNLWVTPHRSVPAWMLLLLVQRLLVNADAMTAGEPMLAVAVPCAVLARSCSRLARPHNHSRTLAGRV